MSDTASNVTLGDALALEIGERRRYELEKNIQAWPRTAFYLSDVVECDRQMYYGIENWKDRALPNADLKARFEKGNQEEREVVKELLTMGYEVIQQQAPVEIKARDGRVIARGKVDGFIKFHGVKVPFEVKSLNPNVYQSIHTIEDFNRKAWLRKYIRQLQMYLYGHELPEGLFIITDCLGHWKIIKLDLDYGEAEAVLKRLERVDEAVQKKAIPERIDYREDMCGKCPFSHICLVDIERPESEIVTDEELIGLVNLRDELKAGVKEFESVDKQVKERFKGVKKALAGDFVVIGKEVSKKEFTVPAKTYWQISIQKAKPNPGELE